jgi:hypothetical protein
MNKLWTLLIIVIAVIAVLAYSRLSIPKLAPGSDIHGGHADSLNKTHSTTTAKKPSPVVTKSPPESKQRVLDVLLELERKNPNMRWVMLTPSMMNVLTPFGPCGSVTQLAPHQFGFNSGRENDRTVLLFPDEESALRAAWKYCDGWYVQEKADRSAAQQIDQASKPRAVK